MSNELLNRLNEKSVWAFTKQTTNFEASFQATKLFAHYCKTEDLETSNLERYFEEHHDDFNVSENRHRMLVISQLFGFITKTPFYSKSQYNKERQTEIYDMLNECEIGDERYKIIKTEQILKLKIHAIIDTANNNAGYNVLPVLFIYKVLRTLKDKYSIDKISIDQLFTYVMTCRTYDEVDASVECIKKNAPISKYVNAYKDFSRVLNVIRHLYLFNIDFKSISINPAFDDYFYNFLQSYDFDGIHQKILRDVDYSYFLYNYQGFNINLIDIPLSCNKKIENDTSEIVELSENDYQNKVDKIKETNINDRIGIDAHKSAPAIASKKQIASRFERNPTLGKIAIKMDNYSCEYNNNHKTFISKTTNKPYMEAHHFVPISRQLEMWDKYKINIDCLENIVSLCPNCHRALHYGTDEIKKKIISNLYNKIINKFNEIGFSISLSEVEKYYDIKK